MAKTITETFEDQNSIEVTRDAKGQFKYTIKLYFSGDQHHNEIVDKTEAIYDELRARFEPEPVEAAQAAD